MMKTFVATCLVALASANVCNGPCKTYVDCEDAGLCNVCMDGSCQHYCMLNGDCDQKPKENNVCGGPCASYDDCVSAGTCNLCLSGTCQHRCVLNGDCNLL